MGKLFLKKLQYFSRDKLQSRLYIAAFFMILFFLTCMSYKEKPKIASECECRKSGKSVSSVYKETHELYDIYGRKIDAEETPERVVSLIPAITDMIASVRPDYRLKGVTHYDAMLPVAQKAQILGGFINPDIKIIRSLNPDLIFASSLQRDVHNEFKDSDCHVIVLEAQTLDDICGNIEIIGRIFHRARKADELIRNIKSRVELIGRKTALIPLDKRLRAMRLMGRDRVMTPGRDSFQNEAIRLAGGIPIPLERNGQIVKVSLKEWRNFNPQVIYGCGGDKKFFKKLTKEPGWKEVDAIKNNRYLTFPCELTCRASTHFGYFIAWLSASMYGEYFFNALPVRKDHIIKSKTVGLDLPYVKSSRVKYGVIDDFPHKTLVIGFKKPIEILSTLEGFRKVSFVGNHYLSPPRWSQGHSLGFEGMRTKICNSVNLKPESAAFLATGADMDNLAVVKKTFRKLKVYALVTAGVRSNAQRQSKDEGLFYPAGTINIIILTNMHLSPGAMTRAIITATEAKTAALQDMDIRSAYTPQENAATGTGTDNVLIAGGHGMALDSTGGHTKMGELIARACYDGITEAIYKQNRITKGRTIFARLKERRISIFELAKNVARDSTGSISVKKLMGELEKVLLKKSVISFMETCLAASDSYNKGLVTDLSFLRQWGLEAAGLIAGKRMNRLIELNDSQASSPPLRIALSALVTGVVKNAGNKD